MLVELDGEHVGTTPVRFESCPGALRLRVPPLGARASALPAAPARRRSRRRARVGAAARFARSACSSVAEPLLDRARAASSIESSVCRNRSPRSLTCIAPWTAPGSPGSARASERALAPTDWSCEITVLLAPSDHLSAGFRLRLNDTRVTRGLARGPSARGARRRRRRTPPSVSGRATLGTCRSSPTSTSTRSSPPSRSSSARSFAALPLVVGGDPHGRGVVATANYVARRFGIGSAMSCAEALRRCPQAVFVRPRMSLYREYSREVWSIVREIVPTVEQAGIDEGYLDLGEVAPSFDDARALAEAVRAVVRARTRLSCSLGVATSKVVAKVASDRRKPGGLTVVRPGARPRFLAPLRDPAAARDRPARRGAPRPRPASRRSATLAGARRRRARAASCPARSARLVRERARGIDPRPLEVSTERISISNEETFARDVADLERLHDELRRMADGPRRAPATSASRRRAP